MEIRRFFTSPSNFNGNEVTLTGDEFLHLHKVLRYKAGFKATVCLNDGYELHCTVKEILSDSAVLSVDERVKVEERKQNVTLYAGLLKNNKLDLVVQKCVELGVTKVIPFTSCNTAETKFNAERADRIALEAAKQCSSCFLSEVEDLKTFDEVKAEITSYDSAVIAYECERESSLAKNLPQGKNVAVVIGPEGGFKDFEVFSLQDLGVKVVSLGDRILRAETASIVAVALINLLA